MNRNIQADAGSSFGAELKRWRALRRISQLELALAASVSQRHVSWLETGRSQPSRQMVVSLSEALDVPLRERNVLLVAAGFAPHYAETPFDAEAMRPVTTALRTMLDHHMPYPGFVVDRLWRIVMSNDAATQMLQGFGDIDAMWDVVDPSGGKSLARLTLHAQGLRPFIANWSDLAGDFLQRMRREMMATGDDTHRAAYESLAALVDDDVRVRADDGKALLPVLPLVLDTGAGELKLFTMITTFGTPQDITLDELRLELFFPADADSAAFFTSRA